jgi:hypothetical protein
MYGAVRMYVSTYINFLILNAKIELHRTEQNRTEQNGTERTMEEARIKRVGFVNARYVQGDGGYVSRIILNSKADSWIDLYRKVRIQGGSRGVI